MKKWANARKRCIYMYTAWFPRPPTKAVQINTPGIKLLSLPVLYVSTRARIMVEVPLAIIQPSPHVHVRVHAYSQYINTWKYKIKIVKRIHLDAEGALWRVPENAAVVGLSVRGYRLSPTSEKFPLVAACTQAVSSYFWRFCQVQEKCRLFWRTRTR